MTQEKRTLLAALLSFLVLMGWYYFFGQKETAPDRLLPPAVGTTAETLSTTPALPPEIKEEGIKPFPKVLKPEERILKETLRVSQEWSNWGARLVKYRIKDYDADLLPSEEERSLVLLCNDYNFNLPAEGEYGLVSEEDNNVSYEAESENLLVRKQFESRPDQYLLNLRVIVENRSADEFRGRLGIGWKARQHPEEPGKILAFLKGPANRRSFPYNLGGKVVHNGDKGDLQELRGNVSWAGIEDRYFLISLISRRVSSDQVLRLDKSPDWLNLSLYPSEVTLPPRGNTRSFFPFISGPKERDSLQVAGVELGKAVDYGWFGLICVPILKLLQIFQAAVGNWGVAIILLTLFVKLLMNPLTVKSMKQMKEMQKLQPKLVELKEKYKDDKQRLNMETMQLFRSHQVNPMGGCLPMILQMPIYIALYKVLYNAIELYRAPFFGFYKDLSAPDPYFILPILLGISMVAQQKMTPSASADPAQKQMMMVMPVMFTAFMLFLPLGLVLYIFVNTFASVLQQWMYQKGIRWRDLIKRKS